MDKYEREILFKRLKEKKINLKNFDPSTASPVEILIASGQIGQFIDSLSAQEKEEFVYMWEEYWARPNQKDPGANYTYWLLVLGRGGGKPISIDTEIPTTKGFKTMGSMQVGDIVFDENGQKSKVTFVSEIKNDAQVFKVIFDDGNFVYADAEHLWWVYDAPYRKALQRYKNPKLTPRVVSTEYIKDNLKYINGDSMFAIPVPKPVDYSEKTFYLDPYFVGFWLTQNVKDNRVFIKNIDVEVLERIRKCNLKTKFIRDSGKLNQAVYEVSSNNFDINQVLEMLQNRRIPNEYLEADTLNRVKLLQGFMDGKGELLRGDVLLEFSKEDMALKFDFIQLLNSLGIKVVNNSKINIVHLSNVDYDLFSIKRKRLNTKNKVSVKQKYRYIIGVEEVNSVPVRCISVDSPNHTFLCTRAYIPTHNTRTGAEWIKKRVEQDGARKIALIARSPAEAYKIMISGNSGILSISREDNMPVWNQSKLTLTWPNGAEALAFSSFEPDKLRGHQYDTAWCDELAAWKRLDETWYNLTMGMRLEYPEPRYIITTTPRPLPIIKDWLHDSTQENTNVYVSYGNTYQNTFLDATFIKEMKKKYEGTRLGEQELYGKVLGDTEGALFTIKCIEDNRYDITDDENFPGKSLYERKMNFIKEHIIRIVVSIDPQMVKNKDETGGYENCETGIIVAGIDKDGYGYLIEDCSKNATPLDWATTAVNAYHMYKADRIVAEKNQGGDMIETTLRQVDSNISFKGVFGKKGKHTRAEPVSAVYAQNKIRHLGTREEYEKLENQMINWIPGEDSPDRLDAMVWAFLELMVDSGPTFGGVIENDFAKQQEKEDKKKSGLGIFDELRMGDLFDQGGSGSFW